MDETTAEKKAANSVSEEIPPGSTTEEKDEGDNSYHLVARNALGNADLGNKKKTRFKWANLGFLESKFIGCSCLILICLWFV